jgi:hypothetical protein
MAVLPDRRTQHLKTAAAIAAVFALAAGSVRAESPAVDLRGTWHVLIHFTDDHTHDRTQMRWDDRVWVFEEAGSRLKWTEYAIVVFRDQRGRFEATGTSRAARVLHAWEPNESQRAQIAAGVPVSDRGRKNKTLRRRGDDWQSTNRATAASASIVSYVENWSIRDPSGKPTFRREDVLGSAESESLEGVTQYTTTAVLDGGNELRGTFVRDESRRGTFRMVRSGDTKALTGTRKSDGQRFQQEFLGDRFDLALDREGSAVYEAVAARADGRGQVSAELRQRVRTEIAAAISERLREAGEDPGRFAREIEGLSEKMEAELIDGGRSPYDVVEMLKDGRINP